MAERPVDGAGEDGGFLSRWSRRKVQARQGERPDAPAAPAPATAGTSAPAAPLPMPAGATVAGPLAGGAPSASLPAAHAAAHAPASPAPEPPPPTMDDVARLTKDSDYSVFTSPRVDPQVRNAALKKLFHAEPQFNVMDGLDVYIDDYSQTDPLPLSALRQMQQARVLGLLDDDLVDQDSPPPDPPAAPAPVADTAASAPLPPPDEDPALQLQPHDAAGRPDPGPSPGQPGDADRSRRPGGEPSAG